MRRQTGAAARDGGRARREVCRPAAGRPGACRPLRRNPSRREAFTLTEVAVATAIIGLAVTALLVTVGSGTRTNDAGRQLTLAVYLAQEIREWTVKLPFRDPDPGDQGKPPGPDGSSPQVFVDDLDDLINVTYCPPRDGTGQPIAALPNWAQTISLTWVDPNDLSAAVTAGQSNVIRVQVDVACTFETVFTTSWLVAGRTNP